MLLLFLKTARGMGDAFIYLHEAKKEEEKKEKIHTGQELL